MPWIVCSRRSKLAKIQAEIWLNSFSLSYRHDFDFNFIKSTGDKNQSDALSSIGGQGLFVKDLEDALLKGEGDIAIHSLKDMPTTQPDKLELLAYSIAEDPRDCLVSTEYRRIEDLPDGTIVGTGSLRRIKQIQLIRPDLQFKDIRGNVDTRVEKMQNGECDALIMATAGMNRLNFPQNLYHPIAIEQCIPAPGQGVLAIQGKTGKKESLSLYQDIKTYSDFFSMQRAYYERKAMQQIEAGCFTPFAAHLQKIQNQREEKWRLDLFCATVQGKATDRYSHKDCLIESPETFEKQYPFFLDYFVDKCRNKKILK